jgi:hypothetical protein
MGAGSPAPMQGGMKPATISSFLRSSALPLAAVLGAALLLSATAGAAPARYTLSLASPSDGSTVSGVVQVQPDTPGWTPARVDFWVDSTLMWSQTSPPYGGALDTTKLSSGQHTLTVMAWVNNPNAGHTLTSTISVNVSNQTAVAPQSTAAPSISGTPTVGQTLSASPGAWSGTTPISVAYQWTRCDSSGGNCGQISNATGNTYTAQSADVGSTLRVVAVASNSVGSSSATSSASGVVSSATSTTPAFSVSETIKDGSTLSNSVSWMATPSDISLTKQVDFYLDGTLTHTETGSPYGAPCDTCSFDTNTLSNGSHTFKVVATETDGVTTGTASATVTVSNGATTQSPAPSPSLYVAPGGSDSNACSLAAPCLSFGRAYALAAAGAVVQVAAGSYGVQTMSVNNIGLSSSQPVVFQPPAGAGAGQVTVQQLNLTGANNLTFKTMTFGSGAAGNRAWYQRYSSNTLCDGCLIHGQLAIDGDGSNMTWQNGEVGNYIANNADPQIGAMRGPTIANAVQPTNVSFLNESFHDIDANTTTSHTECLQVLAVHGLTIKRSKFYRCNLNGNGSKAAIMFSGYDCKGTATTLAGKDANCGTNDDYWNITIENSMFNAGLTPAQGGNFLAFQWDDQFADPLDCKNILVRNNSIIGGLLWGCNLNAASQTQAIANIISYSGGFWSSQCNAVFLYNIWETGTGCPGTNSRLGTVNYLDRSNTATFDLHLQTGSLGIGLGDPTNLPDTDYDGQPRPQGTVDAGADERLS